MGQPFMGVQLGPHSVFDEGVTQVLDTLQGTAHVNALFVTSHAYNNIVSSRTAERMADHGQGVRDPGQRRLPYAWVKAHEEYYGSTVLRHRRSDDEEFADRDVLAELVGPAHERGVALYARMLEPHLASLASYLPNWSKILTIDVYGRRTTLPCWNNPDYRSWMTSTVEDLFHNYELDGYLYGAERSGPLSNVLTSGDVPGCFCRHCHEVATRDGINLERALVGFRTLYEFVQDAMAGERPSDGYFVAFLRILLQYPEILAWEYAWYRSKESLAAEMYGAIKGIKPTARVGWHVYHPVTWDPIFQAEMDYSSMVSYSDWLKPVVYHDIAGIRIHDKYIIPLSQTIFRDVSPDSLRSGLFQALGYSPDKEAALDELPTQGMSPDYAIRQVRRCVEGVRGKIPVYAGVGFDVPTDGTTMRSAPDRVYETTYGSFGAGAAGILISRQYDEMQLANLEAVGRAMTDAVRDGIAG